MSRGVDDISRWEYLSKTPEERRKMAKREYDGKAHFLLATG